MHSLCTPAAIPRTPSRQRSSRPSRAGAVVSANYSGDKQVVSCHQRLNEAAIRVIAQEASIIHERLSGNVRGPQHRRLSAVIETTKLSAPPSTSEGLPRRRPVDSPAVDIAFGRRLVAAAAIGGGSLSWSAADQVRPVGCDRWRGAAAAGGQRRPSACRGRASDAPLRRPWSEQCRLPRTMRAPVAGGGTTLLVLLAAMLARGE